METVAIAIDGARREASAASLSVLDRGFLYGDSAFEVLRTYEGVPFLFAPHLARLVHSCDVLGIPFPGTTETWTREVGEVVEALQPDDVYLRLMVTRGEGPLGLDPRRATSPRRIVLASRLPPFSEELRAKGAEVELRSFAGPLLGPESAGAKVSNYLPNVLATAEARGRDRHEAILVGPGGEVYEGASSNVFVVHEGIVRTPPTSLGILPGITRELVLSLARGAGLPVRETVLHPRDLYRADEVFLTSSLREILPVVRIDGMRIGEGSPGPVVARLRALYATQVAAAVDASRSGG